MRAIEFITQLFELQVKPGATGDLKIGNWNVRYQKRPKEGSKECLGFAELSVRANQQKVRVPETGFISGATSDALLNNIKQAIVDYAESKKSAFTGTQYTVDINSNLAQEIIGHGDKIFADIVEWNGAPTLLLSDSQEGGLQLAQNRNKSQGGHGQQAFGISAHKAKAAGVGPGRWLAGNAVDYMPNITALPLEFHSEVHPGESPVKMGFPGITISARTAHQKVKPNNPPAPVAEEEQFCENCGGSLAEAGKASRALCKSSRSNDDLGVSQLASCKAQGLRARESNKRHEVGGKRQSIKGMRVKGHKYGGPLPYNKSDN